MSSAARKADFIVAVVKNAILDGWTKEEFVSTATSAWDFLSKPGQWGPRQDSTQETRCEHRNQRQGETGPPYCADCGQQV